MQSLFEGFNRRTRSGHIAAFAALAASGLASNARAADWDTCRAQGTVEIVRQNGTPYVASLCKGIAYGTYNSANPLVYGDTQLLDLYKPSGTPPDGGYPVFVWVHGGGYGGHARYFDLENSGSGNGQISLSEDYWGVLRQVTRGYAVVSIDYRLAPRPIPSIDENGKTVYLEMTNGVHFPEPLRDAKQAVRWVKAVGASFGLNPAHIAIGGHSAGGHISAMVGETNASDGFEPNGTWFPSGSNLGAFNSEVDLVIPYSGPQDLSLSFANPLTSAAVSHHLGCNMDPPNTPDRLYFPYLQDCTQQARANASTVTYVSGGPPVYVVHSPADGIVEYEHLQRYVFYLAAANRNVSYRTLPSEAGHQTADPAYWVTSCNAQNKTMAEEMDTLLRDHAGGPPLDATYQCGTPLPPPPGCQTSRGSPQGGTGLLWSALGLLAAAVWRARRVAGLKSRA